MAAVLPNELTSRGCPTHRRCAVESFCERAILTHVQEHAAYGGWHLFGRSIKKMRLLAVICLLMIASCAEQSENMDTLVERLQAANDSDALEDILDTIGIACLAKENAAEFPEEYGQISLSDPEMHVAITSNAYSLAMNGGVTEVVSRMDVESLLSSLREIGCDEIAKSVERMAAEVGRVDKEIGHLPEDEQIRIYSDLKFEKWMRDDNLYYEPEGRYNEIVKEYILRNAADFKIAKHVE